MSVEADGIKTEAGFGATIKFFCENIDHIRIHCIQMR